jgi:AcrR family transcriptional regulator
MEKVGKGMVTPPLSSSGFDMAAAKSQSAQPMGLRERNKRDKRDRIIKAARELFAQKGFEGTTLREVAAAADIGTGTLFLYVKTKEDLLVLVFKHELEPLLFGPFEHVPETDLSSQFAYVFTPMIEHHAQNLNLGRQFLRNMAWVNEPVSGDVSAFMSGWFSRLAGLVEGAKARGEIRPEISTNLIVQCASQMFLADLRRWVGGWITREQLNATLTDSIKLLLTGLEPQETAVHKARARG